jgi:uncharacterized membrane protein
VVFQLEVDRTAVVRVEDLPWSEGYAYQAKQGETLPFHLRIYNFAAGAVAGRIEVERHPAGWEVSLESDRFQTAPLMRTAVAGTVRVPPGADASDGQVVLRGQCGPQGHPVIAFRVTRITAD